MRKTPSISFDVNLLSAVFAALLLNLIWYATNEKRRETRPFFYWCTSSLAGTLLMAIFMQVVISEHRLANTLERCCWLSVSAVLMYAAVTAATIQFTVDNFLRFVAGCLQKFAVVNVMLFILCYPNFQKRNVFNKV